jgi:hypothetical protein
MTLGKAAPALSFSGIREGLKALTIEEETGATAERIKRADAAAAEQIRRADAAAAKGEMFVSAPPAPA